MSREGLMMGGLGSLNVLCIDETTLYLDDFEWIWLSSL